MLVHIVVFLTALCSCMCIGVNPQHESDYSHDMYKHNYGLEVLDKPKISHHDDMPYTHSFPFHHHSIGHSVEYPVDHSVDHPIDHSVEHPVDHSVDHPIDHSVDHPIDPSIVHPCHIHDLDCIRKFFAPRSACKIAAGPVPDPLLIPTAASPLPAVNMTLTVTNLQVFGLNSAKISEFYWNKATNKVVVAFNIKNLRLISPNFSLTFQRRAKESVTLSDYAVFIIPKLTFTTVLPTAPNVILEGAEMLSYVDDGHAFYKIGSQIFSSKDPEVMHTLAVYLHNMPLMITEFFNTAAPLFNMILMQNIICDFGVKPF